jgi:short-subunit dehydrogenase
MTTRGTRTDVALVTGGAGALGAAIAHQLRGRGTTVVTGDLAGLGADHDVDVTDLANVREVVAAVVAQHGSLDVVVATAGIAAAGPADEIAVETWARVLDVNVMGSVNTFLATYPGMVQRGHGHIVFVASLAGLVPTPLLVPYATSKGAVVSLATSLRPEAARHGIGVTAVCPGPIDTPFLDTGGTNENHGVDPRRFLTAAAGPAISPAKVAAAAVRGIEKNAAIVTPGRAGLLWRVARWFPGATERQIARTMRKELAHASAARA